MLKFIREIMGKAPKPSDQAPEMQVAGKAFQPVFDHPDTERVEPAIQTDPQKSIALGDSLCIIEYCDRDGWETRRRITMRSIAAGPNGPLLNAVCHEARAFRQFRVDRIKAVITNDGEVVPFKQFLKEKFDLDPDTIGTDTRNAALQSLRQHMRAPLALLIGAADADGRRHEMENDAIEVYVETEALILANEGRIKGTLGPDVFGKINAEIALMRPQADLIGKAAATVFQWDEDRVERLARALKKVIRADGRIDNAEAAFIAELNQHFRTKQIDYMRLFGVQEEPEPFFQPPDFYRP